jgi:hypothetical protein
MVAAITEWPSSKIIGIHRTYLKPDGSSKAEVEPNKMILGKVNGGAVRLASLGKKLAIAEGIETALSVQLVTDIPTWAALSATFMENIILPPPNQVPEVIIATDHDMVCINAADRLAARLLRSGYQVEIIKPEQEGWDFNDVMMGGRYVRNAKY